MKKIMLVLVVSAVIAATGFAQEKAANVRANWVSGEVSVLGGGASYERMLGPQFSIGLGAYYSTLFFFWNELGIDVFGRYYPWGGMFFVEAGLGYHIHTAIVAGSGSGFGADFEAINGGAITPAAGWKIDIGRPGGFFIKPGIKIPISFGKNDVKNKFGVGVGIVPYFGLGGAF